MGEDVLINIVELRTETNHYKADGREPLSDYMNTVLRSRATKKIFYQYFRYNCPTMFCLFSEDCIPNADAIVAIGMHLFESRELPKFECKYAEELGKIIREGRIIYPEMKYEYPTQEKIPEMYLSSIRKEIYLFKRYCRIAWQRAREDWVAGLPFGYYKRDPFGYSKKADERLAGWKLESGDPLNPFMKKE